MVENITQEGPKFARKVRVRWYDWEKETDDSLDYMQAKFSPCFYTEEPGTTKKGKQFRGGRKPKQLPWFDEVDTDSVKMKFDGLTKKRTIPLKVQKKLFK